MDRSVLSEYGLIGVDVKVTNKIRQRLTTLFDKDASTEGKMIQLSSREEFGLSPAEKSSVKKSVKDDQYWQAAETFIINWVGRKAASATFGVLLDALQEMEWASLEKAIEGCKWGEIEGMVNQRQVALEQLR